MKKYVFLIVAILLAGCGGGGDSGPGGSAEPVTFYAYNFTDDSTYRVEAEKVGEGDHCYIYLQRGLTLEESVADDLVTRFDESIYPGVRAGFGSEPNPGVDGDPKIFILLMDILDGEHSGSYVAGYFYPYNQYTDAPGSNEKEIFFMDVVEGDPSSTGFRETLAHEFQHMIHWNLKDNDDTWLDEAMSEIAPYFAEDGYTGDYSRVFTFESGDNRSDSLTQWNGGLADYGVVYMWSQYMVDRFPDNVFRNILANSTTGIDSVEEYLASVDPALSFDSVFRDWSIAVFSGTDEGLTDNVVWSYKTIDTRPGDHGAITLPGLFTEGNRDIASLPALDGYSIDFYWYTSASDCAALTWTAGTPPSPRASFYDNTGDTFTFDMASGTAYPFESSGILILQNASGDGAKTSTAANGNLPSGSLSPGAKLRSASESGVARALLEATGRKVPVCVHDYLARRTVEWRKTMREGGHAH